MKDGGPAFPMVWGHAEAINSDGGMSLRDWFAGQALLGVIPIINTSDDQQYVFDNAQDYAKLVYAIGDAMINERQKVRCPVCRRMCGWEDEIALGKHIECSHCGPEVWEGYNAPEKQEEPNDNGEGGKRCC